MRIEKIFITITAAILMLWSCDVKDPIYDVDEPSDTQITLTTDWTEMGAGITEPASYTISVAGYTTTATENVHTLDNVFEAGTYRGYAYNTADKVTVASGVATVDALANTTATIDPLPGWFFSASDEVEVKKGVHNQFTAVMQQQVRELTLILKPEGGTADKIESITATTLGGIAQSWNMATNTPSGDAASVIPIFVKQTDGTWQATVRLLGIMGAEQKLAGTITFAGGIPNDILLESDLSPELSNFNALKDAKTPLVLSAIIVATQTEAGFTAIINDWEKVSGSGTAN